MAKKKKLASQSLILTNGGSISIKDALVADPSIEFTIEIDPEVYTASEDGIYFENFTIQLSISHLDPDNPAKFTNVGTIVINTMAKTGAYFFFTFGDPNYVAGTKFNLCMLLSAYDPKTGEPVTFTENPVNIEIYGGGQAKLKV